MEAFSAGKQGSMIYGIPNSGWQSPSWNWGSAMGTGHDCARICRQRYATRDSRAALVANLLLETSPLSTAPSDEGTNSIGSNIDLEEVKLVLALAWQRGRRDGSDGGRGGYGDVLQTMVEAQRYEGSSAGVRLLVQDMQARFPLLHPTEDQQAKMQRLSVIGSSELEESDSNAYHNRPLKICSGLVLEAMGFIDNGC